MTITEMYKDYKGRLEKGIKSFRESVGYEPLENGTVEYLKASSDRRYASNLFWAKREFSFLKTMINGLERFVVQGI